MREGDFKNLDDGDVVRHKGGAESYIVTGNYGEQVIITRTLIIRNHREWDLIAKATHELKKPEEKVTHPEGEYAYQRRLKDIRSRNETGKRVEST